MLQLLRKQLKKMSGSNSLGLRSPAGVNKVRRDNLASRNRTYTTGRHYARNDKQMQPTGATQRCFRCGLTNHSPDKCKYKDFECHRCHQKGHLRSECRNTKPPRPKAEGRQHVRLADQDAAGEAPEGGEDQSLSLFLTWMAHSPLFPRTQVWPHQQLWFLC